SYRELDRRAARLAATLRAQGVEPEEPVAIFAERSPEMVVALLGVLRAGGAYLPLDPSHPRERLAWMLADAGARVILTQRRLADVLPSHRARVLFLDGEAEAGTGIPVAAAPVPPDALAYVIYTSGSTGRPKGVQVSHRSLAVFLAAMARRPGLTEGDALLAVTTLSFDIAALELLLPLSVGATVVVAEPEVPADGQRLARELEGSGATVMQATPATWRMLLDAGWRGDGRLVVLCGGEELSRDLAGELLGAGGALWNLYGPTEATVWATLSRVMPGEGPVPIGRPIPGARLHVLDAGLRPVGIGVTGEIYIGGGALARGYLGRPDLTAERFVPDPFGGPGGRLYRTGDLGRWLPDGQLLCLGRVDQQVKLRGFRIELLEIEAALREHPAVGQAVVALREDAPGDRRLIAYVVPRGESGPPAAAELVAFLAGKLPAYMLPAAFVALESLPLTPNGKVDRRALPGPAALRWGAGAPAPRTIVEELIAGIWSEVLRRDGVGVHDSFFELGGHSLLATQVIARLRGAMGIELPLRRLFTAPTVALLAAAVEEALAKGTGAPPPLARVPRDGELPLSFAQERLWSLHRLDPGDTTYRLLRAFRIEGPLRPALFARALAAV
ncbi:MAG: non-ribosomal peptide synthetase, partial [Thermoanaerobaculia bacterium]